MTELFPRVPKQEKSVTCHSRMITYGYEHKGYGV